MWCVKLILISCLGLVASRPQNQQAIEVRTESADPQVEFSNTSPSAWLPLAFLPSQGFDKNNYHPSSTSLQFYRFPRYHVQSNIRTEQEFRRILKNLTLDEPRNFFDKESSIYESKTMIHAPKEEIRVGQIASEDRKKQNLMSSPPAAKKQPSLAPYRLSPLFHFIQNKNTIQQDKVIRFRTSNFVNEDDITTLILKPQATAVAGVEGKAVSNPLSRAILREGTNVDILFEPAAVAIAGPGGIAHAQSDLETPLSIRVGKTGNTTSLIFLLRSEHARACLKDTTKITLVPFYGGGKGQSLQITETSKGEVLSTVIIKTPNSQPSPSEQTEIEIDPSELENPPLPSKFDTEHFEGYDEYIKNIQNKAVEIVKLQEVAKKNGDLTQEEEDSYQEHMKSINESAKKLAEVQDSTSISFENREGLGQWFERKRESTRDKNKKREEEKKRKKEAEENEGQSKKQKEKEQEEEKEEEEDTEQDNEAVAINLPPEDASVAEAKPVGLAVAGEGGVAASKPIATAVVGPGGLAIARPVGTAIAGVSPDQALVPIYAEGLASGSHKKSTKNKSDQMSEFLNKIISKYHHT